jgi:hypothetical protein
MSGARLLTPEELADIRAIFDEHPEIERTATPFWLPVEQLIVTAEHALHAATPDPAEPLSWSEQAFGVEQAAAINAAVARETPEPLTPEEDETWRDPGLLEDLRNGRPIGSHGRARIIEWYAALRAATPDPDCRIAGQHRHVHIAEGPHMLCRTVTPDPAEPTNPDLACICEACRTTEERP